MYRNLLKPSIFLAGLAVVCWIGVGYAASNPLALSVTLLIGACYLAGGLELHRYRQATSTLATAVDDLSTPPASLNDWLDRLHPSLRNAVRLRIEGERVGLGNRRVRAGDQPLARDAEPMRQQGAPFEGGQPAVRQQPGDRRGHAVSASAASCSAWCSAARRSDSSSRSPSMMASIRYSVRLMRWSVTRPCGKL